MGVPPKRPPLSPNMRKRKPHLEISYKQAMLIKKLGWNASCTDRYYRSRLSAYLFGISRITLGTRNSKLKRNQAMIPSYTDVILWLYNSYNIASAIIETPMAMPLAHGYQYVFILETLTEPKSNVIVDILSVYAEGHPNRIITGPMHRTPLGAFYGALDSILLYIGTESKRKNNVIGEAMKELVVI